MGLIICVPQSAAAQTSRRNTTSATKPSIGIFGLFDYTTITAKQSFDAVFGEHATTAPGVGADAVNLWKGLFVRVVGSQAKFSGERVVVFDGDVFKLGIPLTAALTPIEFGGGWRFQSKNPASRLVPYVGASAISVKYRETSSFADSVENVDEFYGGFGVFGGVDVRLMRQAFAGVEAQYRSVSFKPATYSAAESFKETNMGGAVLRVRLGIRF